MELERFIYSFNLATTLTVNETQEWVRILNNGIDKELDYPNSINLYNLVELFNKYYLLFKKDYDKLTKLDLGEYVEIIQYYADSNDESYKQLMLYVYNPDKDICNHHEAMLYLYEDDGEIHSYIDNCLNFWDENYYRKDLDLDPELVKSYLEFGSKYGLLIDSYHFLRNKFIFGNGCTVLFSKINEELFKELKSFEITFGNYYFNSQDYVNVIFKLGENLSIDYDASKVVFKNIEWNDKKAIIDGLIHKLYVNKSKLSDMYSSEKIKKLQMDHPQN